MGLGNPRLQSSRELARLKTQAKRAGAVGTPRARAVSPVCPTFKVPPCSRGRVLPGCRPVPCSRNGMTRSGGMWGSGCCEAGGLGLHAHPRPRKVRAPARPGRSGRGNVCKAGKGACQSLAGVKGNKVTAWSP